jgi:pSer/pThr/pTyr-binding forkhead associated (FHA) protein
MDRRCARCGHRNPPDAAYCMQCGARVEDDTTVGLGRREIERELGWKAGVQVPRAADPVLVVVQGPGAGSKYLLDREVTTIGRDPASDVFLDDVTVSRRHAEVRRQGDRYFIHDAGSLNGTYVHRIRVDGTQLADGDDLQFGRYRLVFRAGGGSLGVR